MQTEQIYKKNQKKQFILDCIYHLCYFDKIEIIEIETLSNTLNSLIRDLIAGRTKKFIAKGKIKDYLGTLKKHFIFKDGNKMIIDSDYGRKECNIHEIILKS